MNKKTESQENVHVGVIEEVTFDLATENNGSIVTPMSMLGFTQVSIEVLGTGVVGGPNIEVKQGNSPSGTLHSSFETPETISIGDGTGSSGLIELPSITTAYISIHIEAGGTAGTVALLVCGKR